MFIVTILFIIAWETYAVLMKTTVPNIEVLATLAFAIKTCKTVSEQIGAKNGTQGP
jgi:hypothetical protein